MIFTAKKHNNLLYNILLNLSRNIFFYKKIKLKDNFETRIYLMFMHFSILMIISKNKGKKFNQSEYDHLFDNIEYNLRELGLGDVSVNKKMKELNKILYDILLKIKTKTNENDSLNFELISKYFDVFKNPNEYNYKEFEGYFKSFYDFCYKLPLENMLKKAINFKY
tara:strand:+ start:1830 stop:2327 length:498 start_codon:yes stop_codon:yes gene_type:complete